jgi:hypothetical protein
MKRLLTSLAVSISFQSFTAVVYDTLYINKGLFAAVDTTYFTAYAFNDSATFNQDNSRIFLNTGDSLYLTVINNDVIFHDFDITNTAGYTAGVAAGDTFTIASKFNTQGIYICFDTLSYPMYRYMGLGAMIIVDDFSGSKFVWNIKDHQAAWNDSIDAGFTVDWNDYYPDYFTINGRSNPFINDDTTARVNATVSETIRIYISNTGQAIHSMHFHGYHCEIIYSSKSTTHVGRFKDTFPVYSMESLILELIPDKTGEYPVHDHNVLSVTGGKVYPNGLFLTMLIE